MLQSEVINKLAMELTIANGDFDHYTNNRTYIKMALSIGLEHFTKDMEEIVVLDKDGIEAGRFKGLRDASHQLGIPEGSIANVIAGRHHTAGGLIFMKAKDYELVPKKKSISSQISIVPLK